MIITFSLLFISVIAVILIFSSKRLSPIPYFPTQKTDVPLIVKALNLKNNQTVIDLGAGDGIVIFSAASKAKENNLNTKFVAVEINPILIFVLHLSRLLHPNKKNIRIIRDDIFKMNFEYLSFPRKRESNLAWIPHQVRNDNITIYLYISPWYLEKVISNIKYQIADFAIVSYMYAIKSLKNKEHKIQGKNTIFVYR